MIELGNLDEADRILAERFVSGPTDGPTLGQPAITPGPELTDEELVHACRRGSEGAWETLVRRYQRLVYAVPRRGGLDDESAAEVFQQVFTALFERLDSIEQPDRLSAWLVTAAKRETWRIGRRRAAMRLADAPEEEGLDVADGDPLPGEALLRLEEQHAVRKAVQSLDDRSRAMIELLFYSSDPLPYAEIARRLGLAEGSVGPVRARCLKRLRRIFESAEP